MRDEHGNGPAYGGTQRFQADPYWRDYILFYDTSTPTTEPARAAATKPDGPAWWPV